MNRGRVFIGMLVIFALVLVPLRDLVPASDEIWREKAYLPGNLPALAVCYALAILLQRVFARLPFRSGTSGWLRARRVG